jgi:hypothetical protein
MKLNDGAIIVALAIVAILVAACGPTDAPATLAPAPPTATLVPPVNTPFPPTAAPTISGPE